VGVTAAAGALYPVSAVPATDISTARGWARWFRRGPWEAAATAVIGLGIVMLMQPLSLDLYTYSFVTILGGTIGFLVTSHFPK
jgi:hypothetical protein